MRNTQKGIIGSIGAGRWFGDMTSAAKATVIAQGTCVLVLFSKEDVQRATAEAADPDALEGGHDGELSSLYSLEIAKQIGEGMFGKVTITLIEVWNSQWQHSNTLRQGSIALKTAYTEFVYTETGTETVYDSTETAYTVTTTAYGSTR